MISGWRRKNTAFDPTQSDQVQEALSALIKSAPSGPHEAQKWYECFQEISEAVIECHSQLELAVHLDVTSKKASDALKNFESKILVHLLHSREALSQIYIESPWRHSMHSDDKGRLLADTQRRLSLTSNKLTELQLKETELVRKYKDFSHNLTATWEGRSVPLSLVNGYMSHSLESLRKEAFFVYWNTLKNHAFDLSSLFVQLVSIRKKLATEAGFASYAEYSFVETGRNSYKPQQCKQLTSVLRNHQSQYLEPLLEQQRGLGFNPSLPWNFSALSAQLGARSPCGGDMQKLLTCTESMMNEIHPSCGQLFRQMRDQGKLDILPRGGKAGGAFCVSFPKSKMPFVFGNFSSRLKDALTLVHEFGHAFHSHLSSFVPNHLLRTPSMDFCEFTSSSFELLALEHLQFWYDDDHDQNAARQQHLSNIFSFLPFMCTMDDFQHAVYEPSNETPNPAKIWKEVSRSNRSQMDWSSCPDLEELGWLSRSHVFATPFYFFEYGVAYLSAFDFINSYRIHPQDALGRFFSSLQLGGQRDLPDLFQEAGVFYPMQDPLPGEHIRRLLASVHKDWFLKFKRRD